MNLSESVKELLQAPFVPGKWVTTSPLIWEADSKRIKESPSLQTQMGCWRMHTLLPSFCNLTPFFLSINLSHCNKNPVRTQPFWSWAAATGLAPRGRSALFTETSPQPWQLTLCSFDLLRFDPLPPKLHPFQKTPGELRCMLSAPQTSYLLGLCSYHGNLKKKISSFKEVLTGVV